MDRFDSYTCEKPAGEAHGAALREAARDHVAREAAGDRAAGNIGATRPGVTLDPPSGMLAVVTRLPRWSWR